MPAERLGRIPCPECATPIHLRRNERGTLSLSCHECDFSAFARVGTAVHGRWLEKLRNAPPASPAPSPAPAPKPAPIRRGPPPPADPPAVGFDFTKL